MNGRYVYYHCTFGKGRCGGSYVREEELEWQFGEIFKKFQFSEKVFAWTREALRLSQAEKAAFHRKVITGLNAEYLKLQNRIDQMYLDKLDGKLKEKYPKASKLYEVDVRPESGKEASDPSIRAIEIVWEKKARLYEEETDREGSYVLRTDRLDLSDKEIWEM